MSLTSSGRRVPTRLPPTMSVTNGKTPYQAIVD